MDRRVYRALTIAGSDSGGGAGIQADLKTFSALGVYGMSAITAITVQNTVTVSGVQDIDPLVIRGQIEAVLADIGADGIKIGMLSQIATIEAVREGLAAYATTIPIVLDPVMISKSGCHLLQPEAISALKEQIFPLATLVTPNLMEAEALLGRPIKTLEEMENAARELTTLGSKGTLVKGGHLAGDATDILFWEGQIYCFPSPRIETSHTHGTGCTLSSAITAYIAKGFSVDAAVGKAKEYIVGAINHSMPIGQGHGPVNHFWNIPNWGKEESR